MDAALVTAHCYCGKVVFTIDAAVPPTVAGVCECDSCRRAHAAPLYHVVYTRGALNVQQGKDLIKDIRKENSPVVRSFCANCGSRLWNTLPDRPQMGHGVFPDTFAPQFQGSGLPRSFRPAVHYHAEESVRETLGDLALLERRP